MSNGNENQDEQIVEEMDKVLRRKRPPKVCPESMPAHDLVQDIAPAFPDMNAFELSMAVFRLSGRKPFKRRLDENDVIVVCLDVDE